MATKNEKAMGALWVAHGFHPATGIGFMGDPYQNKKRNKSQTF
jgi:hypothetical protein